MKTKTITLLTIIIFVTINYAGEKLPSINLSYGYGGSFISQKHFFKSKAIHEISSGIIIPRYLILGLSYSIDNTFKVSPVNKNYLIGFGPFIGAGLWDSNTVQPYILMKYKFFGQYDDYIRNSDNIIVFPITIQNVSLELGSRIILYKHISIKTGYNLFIYKTGQTFEDQFENVCGISFYLNYEFVSK